MLELLEMIEVFGFQVVCVIVLGMYIAKVQNEQRIDSKDRENRLIQELKELSNTNKVLLETNAIMVKDINRKLDVLLNE